VIFVLWAMYFRVKATRERLPPHGQQVVERRVDRDKRIMYDFLNFEKENLYQFCACLY
jgi:hypothetical protein